jgi:hypothetical protein
VVVETTSDRVVSSNCCSTGVDDVESADDVVKDATGEDGTDEEMVKAGIVEIKVGDEKVSGGVIQT